jgi:hypothetical protein
VGGRRRRHLQPASVGGLYKRPVVYENPELLVDNVARLGDFTDPFCREVIQRIGKIGLIGVIVLVLHHFKHLTAQLLQAHAR